MCINFSLPRNRHGVVVSDITRTEAMKRAISLPPPPSLLISPNAIVSPYNVPVSHYSHIIAEVWMYHYIFVV